MTEERKVPLIILGELKTILNYGPKPMQRRDEWEQRHSNVMAQFLDVAFLISKSTWRRSPVKFNISHHASASLPPHEASMFAAVYFRQLVGGDDLLNRALKTYKRFCASDIRWQWIESEQNNVRRCWNQSPATLAICSHILKSPITSIPTLAELFDAFLYGAHALHSFGKVDAKNVARLRELLNAYPKNVVLGGLHGGLMALHNHVESIAHAINQDFRLWFHTESLPPPEIHWQEQLFGSQFGNFAFDPVTAPER